MTGPLGEVTPLIASSVATRFVASTTPALVTVRATVTVSPKSTAALAGERLSAVIFAPAARIVGAGLATVIRVVTESLELLPSTDNVLTRTIFVRIPGAVAVAVKLSSSGPVIYRSVRPGMAGKPFFCFKFRTMREHADQIQDELEPLNEKSGALFKIRDDPRMTPVGRLLRRFSFDELPQLVNVVRGEMSLVGPRPLPMRDFDRLDEWHKKRYLVLPGITGLWQVSGRSELDFDELVRLDFLYLERWSVFLDLSIMLKTIPAVIRTTGAW